MTHKDSAAIPPTQLVECSYSAYRRHWGGLHERTWVSRIPPTQLVDCSYSAWLLSTGKDFTRRVRLAMNDPPTALVGFKSALRLACRSSVNNPPTALVGLSARPMAGFDFSAACFGFRVRNYYFNKEARADWHFYPYGRFGSIGFVSQK